MIRVLHIIGTMNLGGAETLLMELYRNIDRSKVQFDFLIYNYSGKAGAYDAEILQLGGKIYNAKERFYKNPIKFYNELKSFFELHKEYKIVHAHQYKMSGYMLFAAKLMGNPVTIAHSHIAFVNSGCLRKVAEFLGEKLLRQSTDYYFGCSEDALYQLAKHRSDQKKYFLLRNAINPDKFCFSQERRHRWREKLQVSDQDLVIGNVARFTWQKNHEKIVSVFCEVLRKRPESKLVLIGTGSKEQEIQELTKKLGIQKQVIFLGSRKDVCEIENAFDVFLMPSRYEGLGIVLIEAQANGLPCVISKDVIPPEADVRANLVIRVDLEASDSQWAQLCLQAQRNFNSVQNVEAVKTAGYDIKGVASWLQKFYLEKWERGEGSTL